MRSESDAIADLDAAWLADYGRRAHVVEHELAMMFQKALAREVPAEIDMIRRKTASILYLRRRRRTFAHRIVLFTYSSRFDSAVADRLLDPQTVKAALPEGLSAQAMFERKSANLEMAFRTLVRIADTGAQHHVAALMSREAGSGLPLVWDVPAQDPAETGFPRDAMWWLTFQYLCEISSAIVAYGGFTQLMIDELSHIHGNPRLGRKLLWLDGNLNLFFPRNDEQHWPLDRLPELLTKIAAGAR
jgi:hypothetical protein